MLGDYNSHIPYLLLQLVYKHHYILIIEILQLKPCYKVLPYLCDHVTLGSFEGSIWLSFSFVQSRM